MTPWLVQTLVGTTLAMLGVLALRAPVARLFGARVAYALWLLPALRLVLPPLPGWTGFWEPVFRLEAPMQVGIVDPVTAARLAALQASELQAVPEMPVPDAGWAMDWALLALGLWIAGALIWFGWQMWRYRTFVGGALADAELLTRQGGIDVLVSRRVDGPLAAGILRRRIFLPADFLRRYTADERRLVLLHEGAHHDRRDIAANLAALAVVALHWWNPVAHWAYRAFRTDQELACDATVLAGASGTARHDYGSAVLKSVFTRTPAPVCALNHKTQLKQRIGMMKNRKFGPARLAIGSLFAVTVVGGGLLLTAAGDPKAAPAVGEASADPVKTRVIVMDRDVQADRPDAPRVIIKRMAKPSADMAEDDLADLDVEIEEAMMMAELAGDEGEMAGEMAAAIVADLDVDGMARGALASAQSGLVVKCKVANVAGDKAGEARTLADCAPNLRDNIRASLQSARHSLTKSRGLTDSQRAAALSGLDEALKEIESNPDLGGTK